MNIFQITPLPQDSPTPTGIKEGPAPVATATVQESPPPRRPTPRAPFPMVPILILLLSLLAFLLVVSVGFNVWILSTHERRHRFEDEARRAEQQARALRAEAEAQAALARQQQMQGELRLQALLQQEQEPKRQLEALREQLDEAKKAPANEPEEVRAPHAWGSLHGRVVWNGDLPKVDSLEEMITRHIDAKAVLQAPKDQLLEPTWRIDPKTRGVANVAVFLKRPANGMLPIHEDDRVRKQPVVLDAPFCVYVPHMLAVYPEWFDGEARGKTGQQLVIKNSSTVAQNARISGDPAKNPGHNLLVPRAKEFTPELHPQRVPVSIQDNIHPWMKAYAWVFDHPYHAITKDDGSFTIPRVPADMEVQVMAWHESRGWLFTKDGKTMKLAKGKNTLDFEMSAK